MKKIFSVLKDNIALNAINKNKGEIITQNEVDQAYLIASSFMQNPRAMIVVKESQYQAQLLYQQLKPLLHSSVASIKSVLLSFLPFLRTIIHVAIDVPKNKLPGS